MRLRKRVAFERFLVRLGVAAPGAWVLKGAFALDLRLGRSRTTRDIDLATVEEQPTMMDVLHAACQVPLDDFFTFEARRTNALDRAVGFNAVRYSVSAELAGRRFEQFPLDVAFEEPPVLDPEWIRTSGTLQFADIDPPEIPVVALEQHLAEKAHAYTGRYGTAGRGSTRAKDLIDVVLISDLAELDAERLHSALEATFHRRDQQPLPLNLPPPPGNWSVAYASMAREVGLATDLAVAHAEAASFLDPVLTGAAEGRWDPRDKRWGR